ncbi:MAG TPA: OsmC family protein [Cyclobacteriaceae bacterium]|nr:OsmC family protein [Cyclobacteriaceae bacterium]
MESHYYSVDIRWNKDRQGIMCSPDIGRTLPSEGGCIEIATPPEFPKGIPGIWSPEHLFTASVSSCLMTTFLAIAENSKLPFISFSCKSKGKLEKIDGKFLMSEVLLEPHITIAQASDRERTERIIRKSEEACLISNSIKAKVVLSPVISVAQEREQVSTA